MKRAVIVLLVLAGCAKPPPPVHWDRPGGTAAEFEQTRALCAMNANRAFREFAAIGGQFNPVVWESEFVLCMTSLGWTKQVGP